MQDLRANTEVKVRIGSFVDFEDGVTPETGITLGAADQAELLKHGSDSVVDISGATWAAVANCSGWYVLTLTTSHTDTEGQLDVIVQDASVCLPVVRSFNVLSEAAWDSLYAAKDDGFMDVNVKAISEDTTAADTLELFAEALKQDTGQIDDGTFDATGKTGFALSATGLDLVVKLKALLDGTPSGEIATDADPRTTTAFETTLAEATDDHYNLAFIVFYSGALAGQSRKISDYDGTGKVITVATAFTEAPAVGDDFLIIGRSE